MKRAGSWSGAHSSLVRNGAGVTINASETRADMPVGHYFARVDVGAQIVARDAGGRFDLQHIFGGDALR